ncbi:MAG TPA: serine hydrolase domain-containing protein [Longimicrobiales bacterium]|nr:serine hydrolase domain-containing protein [Longimicrobiales bacterium]
MPSILKPLKLSALLFVLAPATLPAQSGADAHGPAILRYLEQVRNETGAPGISAAVGLGGEMVFSGGVGYAELDNRTPADGETVWNVGSVSKVLAAVAVMQLVERGKVSLDDHIQEYVPSYPEKRAPITLQQILTHTSGIRHYAAGEFGPYGLYEARHFEDINEAIEHFRDAPLLFEPGTLYWYSSHAFNLLQGVVETASGLKFEEYMRQFVWEPAGMASSSFDVPSRIVNRRGRGYVRDDRGILVNPPYVDPSYKYAGGGMLSTSEDLVRFGEAINDGTLLKPETVANMYAVHVDPVMEYNPRGAPVKQDFKMALAFQLDQDAEGRWYIDKTGTVKGTRSVVLTYPEYELVVAIQANALPFDSRKYAQAIAQMYLPPVHEGFRPAEGRR